MFTFFSQQTQRKALPIVPDCGNCGLARKCQNPVLKAVTRPSKTVVVVNGPTEDSPTGVRSQRRLAALLRQCGMELDNCSIVPAIACPAKLGKDEQKWRHCQPLMASQIKAMNPEKIIVYGKHALASVVDWLWGESAGLPDRWYGRKIPVRELNAWVLPIGMKGARKNPQVAEIHFHRSVRDALRLIGRPYDVVPQYDKMVEILEDSAKIIEVLRAASGSVLSAFDYETNSLKPERTRAKVFTASVAFIDKDYKVKCYAFRMTESVVDAWKAYLTSASPKIAANLKFEHRWSKRIYGVETQNWVWDNVIAGHMYDPMETCAGLKFQAFCHLGLPYFAHDVEKYFENTDDKGYNAIHLANMRSLLLYNGIDSLAELDLGILQMYQAGKQSTLWTASLPKREFYKKGEWF